MMMKNKIEILAPAGGYESVLAAVRCGADAVYLGAKAFSARASAQNFDDAELKQAVAYCHERNVLVYLTVNTIVFDSELEQAAGLIQTACRAGVDAVIVQNPGVARMIRQVAPELPIHGSTQMSVHSLSGAKALYEMGFKRVVLARELTGEEIREIARGCPIELEVFVHGALCMCVSGQCYFSAMLGSRSGSRGACAQPCRLPFSAKGGSNGYALSLKDNSLISYLRELQEMGVASAKIEGRMKRPEYVAVAVTACRESRDQGKVCPRTRRYLESVFSRSGFTDGYYTGQRGHDMFGVREKENVLSANEKLLSEIRLLYKEEKPCAEVSFSFSANIDKKPELFVSDGVHSVTITGETPCARAKTKELDEAVCRKQLEKTGGTPYRAQEIKCQIEKGVSLPVSQLNRLRREGLARLGVCRSRLKQRTVRPFVLPLEQNAVDHRLREKRARFSSARVGDAFREFDLIFVPLFSREEDIQRLQERGFRVGVEIPRGMFSRDRQIAEKLISVKKMGIRHVLCQNIGAVYLAKQQKMILHGGFGLNLVNTLDLLWAQDMGLADIELSLEIKAEQIAKLGGSIPRGIVSYGYLPLMLCRNCPNKYENVSCSSCKNYSKMQDRKGETFFLQCDGNCTEVLNCVPLKLEDRLCELRGLDFHTYRFSVENYVESVETPDDFYSKILFLNKFTRGLVFRGVK